MGRFEKRPENPRIRGELSRAAENALWDVVEDLENLQQNLLRTLQEDVKRLEAEKNRLSHDIQKLIEEKEQLQQSRQITEQQVLIRQLAEVLAKHISSQLQSSLKTLATQTLEYNSSHEVGMKNPQLSNDQAHEIGQNVSTMMDSLDHTVTNAFSSLSQELKNYQSDLSQQLARIYSQQQQGETILAEFVNRLRYELEKNRDTNSLNIATGGAPTVLQLADGLHDEAITHQNGHGEKSSKKIIIEPIALIRSQLPQGDSTSATTAILSPPAVKTPEPDSFIKPDLPTTSPADENPQPDSFINPDLPTTSPAVKTPELTTVLTSQVLTAPVLENTPPEISSVLTDNLSTRRPPAPKLRREITPKQQTTPRQQRQRTSPNWSELQIGFLLISLYTVVSSLYNVAIKAIFFTGYNSNSLGRLETQQLILPTLGNIFLILMLRLLVVVPLMLMLSPILHPSIWQDLENLFASLRGKAIPSQNNTKQALFLSIISGLLLFISQVLIYLAIGEVTTSMAIALFFVYPVMSVFLAWFLFQERPNLLITGAMAAIFAGELLVLGGQVVVNNTSLGSTTAILSGIVFAIYVLVTRICATKLKLHPVSLTVINFTTMLLISFGCLIIPLPSNLGLVINSSNVLELVLSAFILGVLTLCGYLFNNFGIRKLGTPLSSLIGATVPIFTVIFAGLMLQESLDIIQVMGVILVTVGAACISWRKTPNQPQPSK
ncbi:EamA family transporter [Dolichospermum circinale CS-537/05]|nr:EamA family transporter [Dolichospermum circinale CS-537/05]